VRAAQRDHLLLDVERLGVITMNGSPPAAAAATAAARATITTANTHLFQPLVSYVRRVLCLITRTHAIANQMSKRAYMLVVARD